MKLNQIFLLFIYLKSKEVKSVNIGAIIFILRGHVIWRALVCLEPQGFVAEWVSEFYFSYCPESEC